MARRLFEELKHWAGGVVTSVEADALLPGQSPRGRNSALTKLAPEFALVGIRRGASPALTSPLSGEPTVLGQTEFKKSDGTTIHVLVCADGSLRKRNSDGTSTIIDAAAFTAGAELFPSFAVARDLLFIANGTDKKKFNGTAVQNWGLAAPAAPVAAAAAGGGMTAGDYDVLLTAYNANTGHESGRSTISNTVTLGGGNLQFSVNWTFPADTQTTHVRIYVRKRAAGNNFYRAVAGVTPAPDATHGGYTSATVAAVLNFSDAEFAAFTLLAPEVNANQPPPSGALSPTFHGNRMFVHDGQNLYYSEVNKPEAFNIVDDYEPINAYDGDEIVGLKSSHDRLLALKGKSTHAVNGYDPNSWEIELVSPTIGAVSQRSITQHTDTFWWDARQGPIHYDGSTPRPLGVDIRQTVAPARFNAAKLHYVAAEIDPAPEHTRVLFALPESGSDRLSVMLPYSLVTRTWESDGWNPFDIASLGRASDSDGNEQVYIGGYSGRLWQWWDGKNDGVPSGATLSGLIASATNTTLTCTTAAGASPGWTVDALKELYVYAVSEDGSDIQRRRISSNTANVLTISSAWSTNPNATYTFFVGWIQFEYDSPWLTGAVPFMKKRLEFLFTQFTSEDSDVEATVELYLDYDTVNARRTFEIDVSGEAAEYDASSSLYDSSRFALSVQNDARKRVGKTARAWRVRVRNLQAEKDLVVMKLAMQSSLMTTKV